MASLAERLQNEVLTARKPPLEAWLATLDDEDLTAIRQTAANPRVDSRTLAAFIRREGVRVGVESLDAWRRAEGYPG